MCGTSTPQQGRDSPCPGWVAWRQLCSSMVGRGSRMGACAPTSHTLLTGRLTPGSSSGPWGIYLSEKQMLPLHCPCTARICFAKPGGDKQCMESTQRNCRLLAVIHELISQAVIITSTDIHTSCCPGSVLCLQSPSHSAHQWYRRGVGWSLALEPVTVGTWLTLLAHTHTTHFTPQAGSSHAPAGVEG